MKPNIPMFRRLIQLFREDPRRLDMQPWIKISPWFKSWLPSQPPCGTVGCIAGWAVILDRLDRWYGSTNDPKQLRAIAKSIPVGVDIMGKAQTILGIDEATAEKLFIGRVWPDTTGKISLFGGEREYLELVILRIASMFPEVLEEEEEKEEAYSEV